MTLHHASRQSGDHPRPQMLREDWVVLDQSAGFRFDDDDRGLREHWYRDATAFTDEIRLPFPPESEASGIADTGHHPVSWYRIVVDAEQLRRAGWGAARERVLLHFGAVDARAHVWVDGTHVGSHDGGQVAFAFDITDALDADADTHAVVVRAHDDPLDIETPRGKQDWRVEPHVIWYHRTSGIWKTVWVEAVSAVHVAELSWTATTPRDIALTLRLNARPAAPVTVKVELRDGEQMLARQSVVAFGDSVRIHLDPVSAEPHELLWSPDHPKLLDATIELEGENGTLDAVGSYLGIRSIGTDAGRFKINGWPHSLRAVLGQGYWPQSHLTAPSAHALREEVELIKSLGFTCVRIHQKVEDPRMLYWADRLGLLVWAETAAAYAFSETAVERFVAEWMDIVKAQRSHPSVVAWVPFNESWGLPDLALSRRQQSFVRAVVALTRALDPTRPVVSNDGWEHVDSDLLTVHDYEQSAPVLAERYSDMSWLDGAAPGAGSSGRAVWVGDGAPHGARLPVMLSEFGGVLMASAAEDDSWGYGRTLDAEEYERVLRAQFGAVWSAQHVLSGFCYTQLTDTLQEKNGLCDDRRRPKLPPSVIAEIVRGEPRGN